MSTDRISGLPNPVLNQILSRLHSTEEAVRTSVLSTRWRYVWTSIQSLEIDRMCRRKRKPKPIVKNKLKENRPGAVQKKKKKKLKENQSVSDQNKNNKLKENQSSAVQKKNNKSKEIPSFSFKKKEKVEEPIDYVAIEKENNKFKEFVYWVLANRKLDLDSFSLDCRNRLLDAADLLTLERWIHIAVMRKVKHLAFLVGGRYGAIMLPRSVDDSLRLLKSDLYQHSIRYRTAHEDIQPIESTKKNVDRISSLPDRILHRILSRLNSTRPVVRTSVLSTRWRYLWTSVPSLDINSWHGLGSYKFKEFVYWVLSNRKLDLDSFTLSCSNFCDTSTIGRWIHLVVMRKVKKLDLKFSLKVLDEAIVLPRCLVDCDSLEVLKLTIDLGQHHPLSLINFTGSKTLKVLELCRVKLLERKMVKSFFKNCPLLEELSLIDCMTYNLKSLVIMCPNLKNLKIKNQGLSIFTFEQYEKESLCERLMVECPKLVYLVYEGHMANHFVFKVKSLKKAVIKLEDRKQNSQTSDSFGVTVRELFAQVSHVEYLSINYLFVQSISFTEEDFPQSLPNLKTLELTIDYYLKDRVLRILKCFPNLETLHLTIHKDISPKELETFVEKLEEVETRNILTHLKKVEFLEYNGERETLDIAQFLLEHGSALEKLIFSWNNKDEYHKHSMEAMDEVSKFYKASLSVKVINLLKLKT